MQARTLVATVVLAVALLTPTPAPQDDPCDVDCIEDRLAATLARDGQAAAFTQLQELADAGALAGREHFVAHHLAHRALELDGNVTRTMQACPDGMGSGCVHGVVEAYLDHAGPDADLAALCSAPRGERWQHQCWHGVGHGLEMALAYNWTAAAARCSRIAALDDRLPCASGVFMENAVADGMADMPHLQHAQHAAARPDDLAYPCNALTDPSLAPACWTVQPTLVLRQRGGDVQTAMDACAAAGTYAPPCAQGLGELLGAQARRAGQAPLPACALGAGTVRSNCVAGVVLDAMNQANSIAPGLQLCASTEPIDARPCYLAVGSMNVVLQPDRALRAAACAPAPEPARNDCTDGPAPS